MLICLSRATKCEAAELQSVAHLAAFPQGKLRESERKR